MAELAECVINVSEGRDAQRLDRLAASCAELLLDRHVDPDHHRSVFTLAGPDDDLLEASLELCREAVRSLAIDAHAGVHPRLGVVDVVPFVPLGGRPLADAEALRDRFAGRAADELNLPVFLYGPTADGGRTLPELRRRAFKDLHPDLGPAVPHPTAGAVCAGARELLVAWNLIVEGIDLEAARELASAVRGAQLRTLAFAVAAGVQVSCNLIDPLEVGPAEAYDAIVAAAEERGGAPGAAELVGLVPAAVVEATDPGRYAQLGIGPSVTIEGRLAALRGTAS